MAALAMLALAACRQEQDFDQRYAEAQRRVEARVKALDQGFATESSDAAGADVARPKL